MRHALRILHPERFTSIGHQLTCLIITCILLSVMLYKPFTEFHPIGAQPFIKPIAELTSLTGKQPAHVHVGMHITDFLRFDTIKNEFIINAFIWFTYDSAVVKNETIDQFFFTKGEITHKSPPTFKKVGDTTIAFYTIRVQFSTILDYARFPIDDQRIFLNLTNQAAPADELVYDADRADYIISKNIYVSGWDVVGHAVKSGYAPVQLGKETTMLQNKTVFSLDLSKGDLRQLAIIVLPLLFLFYLGLFAFSIKDVNIAMTLPLASIASLFAYSLVIQFIAPMVGYMMLSDYLFLFFLLATFIIMFVKALMAVPETILSRSTLRKLEGITIIGLQVMLIIIWYLLVAVHDI